MKPFNLEEAKAGKPICTKDGNEARIIIFDKKGEYKIVGLIEYKDSEEIVYIDSNGKSSFNHDFDIDTCDLYMRD